LSKSSAAVGEKAQIARKPFSRYDSHVYEAQQIIGVDAHAAPSNEEDTSLPQALA